MANEKKQAHENLRFYEQLRKVPQEALKPILAGRLKGKSNIEPVWRIKAMTEAFGPCGIGWKYEIVKQWQEVYGQEVKSFTNINLYINIDGEWSAPIPGNGGATLVEVSKSGIYVNDEGYKMSLTDALSVAMKALGVAADVYFAGGIADADSKYNQQGYMQQQQNVPEAKLKNDFAEAKKQIDACLSRAELQGVNDKYQSLWQYQPYINAINVKYQELPQ